MGVDHPTIDKIKKKFQSIFGISLPLIKNVWPLNSRVTVVVGKPLAVPKVENPPDALVQEYLHKYIDSLTEVRRACMRRRMTPRSSTRSTAPSTTIPRPSRR